MTPTRLASLALALAGLLAPAVHGQFPSLPKIDPPKLPGLPGTGDKPSDGSPKKPGGKQGGKKDGPKAAPNGTAPGDAPGAPSESPAAPGGPGQRPNEQAPSKSASPDQRPAFAALVTAECRQDCGAFPAIQARNIDALLDALAAADRGPAPLQAAYAKDLAKTLRTARFPQVQEGMAPAQVDAIRKAVARGDKSSFEALADSLELGIPRLERWISAAEGRTGVSLSFASKGGGGRKDGFRTIAWGPIAGWRDDVARIEFDDGVVFERLSAAAATPLGIRNAFMPNPAEWPGAVPPLDALTGKVDLLVARRQVEGVDGVMMEQRMLVVDGELAAVMTALGGTKDVMPAATKQWSAVVKDAGESAEVVETLRLDAPMSSHVRWNGDRGIVTAIAVNSSTEELVQPLILKSDSYEFAVKSCVLMEVDESVRRAVVEYVQDLEDMTREERLALVPDAGQRVLILDCMAVGTDQTKYCQPKVALVDDAGKVYADVGELGRHRVLMGLRGNRLNRGGSGADVPFDLQLTTLAKMSAGDPDGTLESHGARARVFYVPADAKGLVARLEGCDRSLALPSFAGGEPWSRAPVEIRRTVAYADSYAAKNAGTACGVTRQWSKAIMERAEKAASDAAEQASKRAAAAQDAAAASEAERKRKLESSFD